MLAADGHDHRTSKDQTAAPVIGRTAGINDAGDDRLVRHD